MKDYLFGLIGLALLGGNTLLGQTLTAAPYGPGSVPVGAPGPVVGPDDAACTATKTTCVPESYLKKITKTVYKSGSEPLCLPFFRGLFGHGNCDSGHCEHPYARCYLMKKIVTHEENAIRCVPVAMPACEHGHCRPIPDCSVVLPSVPPTVEAFGFAGAPVPPAEQVAAPKAK